MAKDESGIRRALNLDEKARALAVEKAAEGVDAEQIGLFEGSSVFGTLVVDGKRITPNGRGRPRGSVNKSTADTVKYILSKGRHPLIALAEVVATPIDVLAATLGCKKIEAAEFWRKCNDSLAPYVAQKQPMALQVETANAGMLMLQIGTGGQGGAGSGNAFGLDMRLVAGSIPANQESEQNQGLIEGEAVASHDAPSHE